jgi:hypothetical protein
MYWEALGMSGPVTETIDALAKWVQWALGGIANGASSNEAVIRYNLSQFWKDKMEAYYSMEDYEKAEADKLDVMAHGILSALDTGLIYSKSPSYWNYWKTFVFGGIPERPETDAIKKEAEDAANDAATIAKSLGNQELSNFYKTNANNVKSISKDADTFWGQKGILSNPLGIPLWGWAIGLAALFIWSKK